MTRIRMATAPSSEKRASSMLGKAELESAISVLDTAAGRIDFWLLVFTIVVAVGVAGEAVFGIWHLVVANKLTPLRTRLSELTALEIADAQQSAAQARLALEQYKAPRSLSVEQVDSLIAELRPFGLTANIVVPPPTSTDTGPLASLLHELLAKAGWKVGFINALGGWVKTVLVCTGKSPSPRTTDAATKLILALRAAGISAFLDDSRGPQIDVTGMGAQLPNADMTILVGSKE
jgi:hypothetical protein